MFPSSDLLHLEYTLICGQAFRWSRRSDGWWVCALATEDGPRILKIKQDSGGSTEYPPVNTALVRDYFRLDVDLNDMSRSMIAADPGLSEAIERFRGLRVLRQDPVECLFSFLCTSAAPLHRIRKSVCGLCSAYGVPARDLERSSPHLTSPWKGEEPEFGTQTYFAFPEVERLACAAVEEMFAMGLGYRARFVRATAEAVMERGGADWLRGLRGASYSDAHAELCRLPGVGAKIADCVCLFSLDKDEAIPVDTHIWQVAVKRYGIGKDAKSLTPRLYQEIGDALRGRFGPRAGWAQQYLFFEDLYERGAWSTYVNQLSSTTALRSGAETSSAPTKT